MNSWIGYETITGPITSVPRNSGQRKSLRIQISVRRQETDEEKKRNRRKGATRGVQFVIADHSFHRFIFLSRLTVIRVATWQSALLPLAVDYLHTLCKKIQVMVT